MLIYDTMYGSACSLATQAKHAFPYLVQNKSSITLNNEDLRAISGLRSFTRSLIVDMFRRIVDEGALDQFAIMNLSIANKDIPDVVTMDELTVDGKYLEGAPSGFDKPWINITPLLGKRKSKSEPLTVVDVPRACGYFVRANLCAGYHDKGDSPTESWLSPSIEIFVIESYSMTVALLLQRVYNLDFQETKIVQTLFAYHYARLLSKRVANNNVPSILFRCSFLGSPDNILHLLSTIDEKMNGELHKQSLNGMCNVVATNVAERMNKFNLNTLLRLFSASAIDSQSMLFALDYPPYWVHQILRYLSGAKNYVIGQTMNLQSMKREGTKFEQALLSQRSLIHKR